jgi:arylsulfatase A-like enzyme
MKILSTWALGWAAALFVSASVLEGATEPKPTSRPNIVILLADDMGFSDIGCYGSEIATPHLDRLAGEGLRFTQFYNGARCCPTRAALLTGLYAHQAGIGHMVNNRGIPAYQGFLNDRCVTIAEVLRDHGYATLMSGKWHVGESRPHWPTDRGFDRYFGLISGASSYFALDTGRQMALGSEPFTPPKDGFYLTDAIADHAVQFLEEWKGTKNPFFLYVAFTAPHWPLHAPADEIAKYRGKYREGWDQLRARRHQRQIELGIVDSRWAITPRDEKAPAWNSVTNQDEMDLRMAVYAAQVDRLDQGIGRVLAKVDQLGVSANTLVMFLADNGGCAEVVERGKAGAPTGSPDSYSSYGLPWANASNTPFRLYKHWVHEGGISTPMIVRWPAVVTRKGGLTRQPGHLIDLMATCLDAAGATYPINFHGRAITPTEGKSLVPVFRGQDLPERALFWEHEGNRAVRLGPWKLVSKYPGTWELFNLEADRTELQDLAVANPGKVTALTTLYDAWAQRAGVEPWTRVRSATNQTARNGLSFHLFTSFPGNGESGLYLALSQDGYHWTNLNRGQPALRPEIGESKLMGDPCLACGPKGTYHLVWTTGWTADKTKVLGYANSKDLVRWEDCSKEMVFPAGQRHGTVLEIPAATANGQRQREAASAAAARP